MKKPTKKLPDGSEIMRRRSPRDLSLRPARFEFDPKKAYTTEQLAEIGAITLRWNQVEAHIDFVGSHILFSKSPIWLQIAAGKALSNKAKIKVLREGTKHADFFDDQTKLCIEDSFTQIEECRGYRNAIIHHHIYDHEKGIGAYSDASNASYQILVSIDALRILYQILCSLLEEVRVIDLLFRIEMDDKRFGKLDTTTHKFQPFSDDHLKKEIIPQHLKKISALQKARRELQKLPKFPDAALIRALNDREEVET